jgi:hypothetical protein
MNIQHLSEDTEVLNTIDLALVHAIDSGATLVKNPSNVFLSHKRTFHDIEAMRFFECVDDSWCTLDFKDIYPLFTEFENFDIRDIFVCDSRSSMVCARYAAFNMQKRARWPECMCAAEDSLGHGIETMWRVNWAELPYFASRTEEYRFYFERVYVRYAAYMELHDMVPVPMEDIWIPIPWEEAWPCDSMWRAFDKELADKYPFEMRLLERVFLPGVVQRRHSPSVVELVPQQPSPPCTNHENNKRKRNRGTSWEKATDEEEQREKCILRQSLDMSCLDGIEDDIKSILVAAIEDVVVEKRYRAENKMVKQKTEKNKKRSKAPLFQYAHSMITHDVLENVLVMMMQGKEDAVAATTNDHVFAPSRAACMCCLLFIHDIPEIHWPKSHNFPRRPLSCN